MKEDKKFDEVEQCLILIEQWKTDHKEPVPEKLLDLLEQALEVSLKKQCQKKYLLI